MSSKHADWYKLTEELTNLGDHELRNAFKCAGDDDERLKYPTLAREVMRIIDNDERWIWSPKQAVIDVIQVAFEDIPERFTGRNPDLPHQELGKNKWKDKPEREIAEFLYGYRDNELPVVTLANGTVAPHTYSSYLSKVYKLLGHNKANSATQRALLVVRQDMATAIIKLKPNDPRLRPFVRPAAGPRLEPMRSIDGIPTLPALLTQEQSQQAECDDDTAPLPADSRPESNEVLTLPIALTVRTQLEAARKQCEQQNRRFRTPHLLMALLDMETERVLSCFDLVHPSLGHWAYEQLREYATKDIDDPFVSFEWDEVPEVRSAQKIAKTECTGFIGGVHLLLAILKGDSETKIQLAAALKPHLFLRLIDTAENMSRHLLRDSTPGVIWGPDGPPSAP